MAEPPRLLLICDLRLLTEGMSRDFKQLSVSAAGAARLPLSEPQELRLTPGQSVKAEITLPDLPGAHMEVQGRVIRELTRKEEHVGVRFDWALQPRAEELLKLWIEQWGNPVVPNRRKSPRLASPDHPQYPKCARARKASESVLECSGSEFEPWEAQVADLSAEGISLLSTNPLASHVRPGDGLNVILEPDKGEGFRIETLGGVRRITEALDPATQRLVRAFGLRFEWLDDDQRVLYLSLVKSICQSTAQE